MQPTCRQGGNCRGGLNPPTTIVNPPTNDRTILIGGVDDNPPTSFIFLVTPPLQGLTPPKQILILLYNYYMYIILTYRPHSFLRFGYFPGLFSDIF